MTALMRWVRLKPRLRLRPELRLRCMLQGRACVLRDGEDNLALWFEIHKLLGHAIHLHGCRVRVRVRISLRV